jgi:hypothetical protein
MPGPEFVSVGAEAGNAIQKFLVQRALADRQAQIDALAKQAQEAEIRQKDTQLQQQANELALRTQVEGRAAKDSAATRAALEDERGFRRATTRVDNSLPGELLDEPTRAELDKQGYSGAYGAVPGVLMQGPVQGDDQSDAAREAQIGKSPDTYQMRGGSKYLTARAAAQDRADLAQERADAAVTAQKERESHQEDMARLTSSLASGRAQEAADRKADEMVKIGPFTDPDTGRAVTKYIRRGDLGKVGLLDKPVSGVLENRLEASEAVVNTGDKMIQELYNPELQKELGPLMGQYNTLEDFFGDPPEKFKELAGRIHSYALAMMGVHGMRSAEAAQKIIDQMGLKHTPESLISMMKGLREFPVELLTQAHRKPKMATAPTGPASAMDTPDVTGATGAAGTTTKKSGSGYKVLNP